MLEEYLVEHLPRSSLMDTFGCELTFINADTQMALQDPIQEDLWKNNHFNLFVRDCFRMMAESGVLEASVPFWLKCRLKALSNKLLS